MRLRTFFIFIAILSGLNMLCSCDNDNPVNQSDPIIFGISFPPMQPSDLKLFTSPMLNELGVKDIHYMEHWDSREPTQDQYDWTASDSRFETIMQNDIVVNLTLNAVGPEWNCEEGTTTDHYCQFKDDEEFRQFVRDYLNRYHSYIDTLQFCNEWMWTFEGTKEEYVELNNIVYEELQQINPSVHFALGSVAISKSNFLALSEELLGAGADFVSFYVDEAGNPFQCDGTPISYDPTDLEKFDETLNYVLVNAKYDELDIHLYDDFWNWDEYETAWRNRMQSLGLNRNIEIIVTEYGGPHPECEDGFNQDFQAQRLAEYMNTLWDSGLKKAFFFKPFGCEGEGCAHPNSSLYESSPIILAQKKPTFYTYQRCAASQANCY